MNQHTAFALGMMFSTPERRAHMYYRFSTHDLRWLEHAFDFEEWLGGQEWKWLVDQFFDPSQIDWGEIGGIALDIWDDEAEENDAEIEEGEE